VESSHRHPVFAPLYAALVAAGERGTLGRWRREALAGARGRLLVVGVGPGRDLDHVPPAVTEVVAVEPNPAMRRYAAPRVASLRERGVRAGLVSAVGEALPLPDRSVDCALVSLVLCSVDEPAAVVAELRRVLVPGGPLLVLEHVRADGGRLARVQDRLDPAWVRLAGGCHTNRRTREVLEAGGFETSGVGDVALRAGLPHLAPHLLGVALAPVDPGSSRPAAEVGRPGGSPLA
jgi:ubiquinone/menaquinone biosynthesis C-methylase UbiE